MADRGANTPIVIKRITLSEKSGHHGGAWKVAYADFVTAMMAFFLLMWLLNATTEKQREGLADYFNPTIVRTLSGTGGAGTTIGDASGSTHQETLDPEAEAVDDLHARIQDELAGIGAESMQRRNILRHVVTRVTDEGLVIDLGDLADAPLFLEETDKPTATARELAAIVARVLSRTDNQLAISGHVRSYPAVLAESPIWTLSTRRADAMRTLLEGQGLSRKRVQRVTGNADRYSLPADPTAESNNRIEVILLN